MDWTTHRQSVLRHCLWMASFDPAYAQVAAEQYERESCGVLEGLADKVKGAIEKHKEKADADSGN